MSTTRTTNNAETRWLLEPAYSSAEFRVPNLWGLVKVKGHFDALDGLLEIHQNGDRRLELIIDASNLNTGNRKRDEHLSSADYFDSDEHPEVNFRSTSASDAKDGRLHVEGELAAAGRLVPRELDATVGPADDDLLHIDATTVVDQRLLGMTRSPFGMVRTPTTLHVHALLRRERS